MTIVGDMLFSKNTRRIPIQEVRPGDLVWVPFRPGTAGWEVAASRGLYPAEVFMRHSADGRENTVVHYYNRNRGVVGPLTEPRGTLVRVWRRCWDEVKSRADEVGRLTLDEAWERVGARR
jgi:predicted P-loop ATPase/GTPase